jgi:hypothetical protein
VTISDPSFRARVVACKLGSVHRTMNKVAASSS